MEYLAINHGLFQVAMKGLPGSGAGVLITQWRHWVPKLAAIITVFAWGKYQITHMEEKRGILKYKNKSHMFGGKDVSDGRDPWAKR